MCVVYGLLPDSGRDFSKLWFGVSELGSEVLVSFWTRVRDLNPVLEVLWLRLVKVQRECFCCHNARFGGVFLLCRVCSEFPATRELRVPLSDLLKLALAAEGIQSFLSEDELGSLTLTFLHDPMYRALRQLGQFIMQKSCRSLCITSR